LVLLVALIGVGGATVTIGSLVFDQFSTLVANVPQLVESADYQLQLLRQSAIEQCLPIDLPSLLEQGIDQLGEVFQLASAQLLAVVTTTISSLVNILFFLVLVIFILVGGESAWNGIFSWLPSPLPTRKVNRQHAPGTACTEDIKNGIDNRLHIDTARTIARFCGWNQALQ
jgi:predicted PurR-regulated permease PerM